MCRVIQAIQVLARGLRFHPLYTNHKPLTFPLHKVSNPWTARQSHHLAYVAEFTTDM